MQIIRTWLERHFSDPQVVGLAVLLAVGFSVVVGFGNMLAPVIASVVIAYLLEGLIGFMERRRVPRMLAVFMVFLGFLALLFLIIFALLPLLSQQVTQFFQQLPQMIARGQELLMGLPERHPNLFSEKQVSDLIAAIRAEVGSYGQRVLSWSLGSVVDVITLAVYLIIMPFLVFFFLKDKRQLADWMAGYLPRERRLAASVWRDVDRQIGNYVRGKFIEIFIVWAATYITFKSLNLQFSMLLSVLVGLSVLIPFVGAMAVTLPVALIAYFQWGLSSNFVYVLAAYAVIQLLDGYVLVPLLFSEVVDLHPVAIIVAVLVFGGVWGFWGVFFAIPLATLVQAVLKAWPSDPGADRTGAEVPEDERLEA
jgi:putative permease